MPTSVVFESSSPAHEAAPPMLHTPSSVMANAQLPQTLEEVNAHGRIIKRALRDAGFPPRLLASISTRALRSGRRQTGEFQSNRNPRWTLDPRDPQFGTELDCKIIELRLLGMTLQFDHAPTLPEPARVLLETHYLGQAIVAGSYQDSLLLERMDFNVLVEETTNPRHGSSDFHLGHEDPTIIPKHVPSNISWRSHRSNLIQGNMTLRQARIYFLKLIARYFELGEIDIT